MNALATIPFPQTEEQLIAHAQPLMAVCQKELGAALEDMAKHAGNTVLAAVRVGHAAITAKSLVPEGQFTSWLKDNFPDFSPHWARRCMAAAVSYQTLSQAYPDERDGIMVHMTSIEKLANLSRLMDKETGKVDGSTLLLQLQEAPKAVMGRPKLTIAKRAAPASTSKGDALDDEVPPQRAANKNADLAEWDAELTAWEERLKEAQQHLEAKQEELQAWEQRLEERERQLTLAAPATTLDADTPATAETLYPGADKPEWPVTPAMRAAADATDVTAKAPRKRGGGAGSRAKANGKGSPAPAPENRLDDVF
jgi:hypothetical protein